MSHPPEGHHSPTLEERFRHVRMLLCDVDGVLTDASIFMGGESEVKRFNIRDGLGIKLLQREGIKVGWVSNRPSYATTLRATELKIDYLFQAEGSKVEAIDGILKRAGMTWADICYIGDDVVDLGALQSAGIGVAPADATAEACEMADYVTKRNGGYGAVREVVEMILRAQGRWEKVIKRYLP